jgi:hypothetical protein
MPHLVSPDHFRHRNIHEKTSKTEIDQLVHLGIMKWTAAHEWAAPTFIVPKKDGRVPFPTFAN